MTDGLPSLRALGALTAAETDHLHRCAFDAEITLWTVNCAPTNSETVFIQFEVMNGETQERHRKITYGADAGAGRNAAFGHAAARSEEVFTS